MSLRSFRSDGIQTMVTVGMIGGFGFSLFAEIARRVGIAGVAPSTLSVGVPIVIGLSAARLALLHQEDG